MTTPSLSNIEDLLPHKGKMILIDRILDCDMEKKTIRSEVAISPESMFFNAETQSVPAWIGIEYMAQTIAAYSSLTRKCDEGEDAEPKIGLLLGTRSYKCSVDDFPSGQVIQVSAVQSFFDSQLASFLCCISSQDDTLAEAQVNAYQPVSISEFLN